MKKSLIQYFLIIATMFQCLSASNIIISFKNGSADSLNISDISKFYIADRSANAINISLLPELRWRVVPGQFVLFQNYPNPFNNTTVIPFQLPRECDVKIIVYDLLGREVLKVTDRRFPTGYHRLSLATESLSSGEYLYTITADKFRETKKFSIIK
ncbi:T9SS type A sorting domain-containing protein [bacterium]|nr:T9SS type A sorting domain-containing protein [bacterium]MBU1065416.1 T9SS type A sorting domain-containing protein [bacterium]MBU1633522.1 T9SS type A sorting domain-containing protein [bacterium]MBU1874984.1 T9SS type A sorting domain-containing protein [bacterium]